jgi:hypothetical protein
VLNASCVQFPYERQFVIKLNKLKKLIIKRNGRDLFVKMELSVMCELQTWIQIITTQLQPQQVGKQCNYQYLLPWTRRRPSKGVEHED